MTELDRFIGQRLRDRREQIGQSADDLAHKLGIAPGDLRDIENGEQRLTASLLTRVCAHLDVNPHYFVASVAINAANDDETRVRPRVRRSLQPSAHSQVAFAERTSVDAVAQLAQPDGVSPAPRQFRRRRRTFGFSLGFVTKPRSPRQVYAPWLLLLGLIAGTFVQVVVEALR
ncbi:MAG: helix-turn-helix domain-containing protein [Hyphomicrobiaceae bacterium]